MRYCPSPFVVTVVEILVLSARRTTFAPGTTWPDGSVTVPLTAPVGGACPNKCPQMLVNSRTNANVNRCIVVVRANKAIGLGELKPANRSRRRIQVFTRCIVALLHD